MVILETLLEKAERSGLSFLVVGGHAVNAHGFRRTTGDVDLAVREEDRSKWIELLTGLKYKELQDSQAFVRFTAPELGMWPVDLMLLNQSTFEKIQAQAVLKTFGRVQCFVPSIEHLISMKLHALKSALVHRQAKDTDDIIRLAEVSGFDLTGDLFEKMCQKFATPEIYEQIINNYKGRQQR